MPRTCSRVIALGAMVVALSTAQAAEPETLTLACEGTKTLTCGFNHPGCGRETTKPISIGIVVNFKTRTVQGPDPFPLEITSVLKKLGVSRETKRRGDCRRSNGN